MKLSIEKIEIFVANKQMNLTDLIKEAHVSTLTFWRIRHGKDVNTKTAGKLAAVLDVDVREILKEDNNARHRRSLPGHTGIL